VQLETAGQRSADGLSRRKWNFSLRNRVVGRRASLCGSAAYQCRAWLLAGLLALAGCGPLASAPGSFATYDLEAPSSEERYCAWYADAREGVLYFGAAAFWSAKRAHAGDPTGDLRAVGPALIGRFDLRDERPLAPLNVAASGARSGVWDVLAHPNGRVYFTTFYEAAGYADPASAEFVRFPELGSGLNELALGPGDNLLASRYGSGPDGGSDGTVLIFDPAGKALAEFPLRAPPGYRVAPKTVAYDPVAEEIWVTTDLLATDPKRAHLHDARVLDARGEALRQISDPEIQFVAFARDGRGYRAEVEGRKLWLRVTAPGAASEAGQRILLDDDFASALDFVQDIQLSAEQRVVVTRWSGWVHLVEPTLEARRLRFPAIEEGGLYYSGVAEGGRICVTHCADLSVVCSDVPSAPSQPAETR